VSVENLDGDGYADQPSIIYAFDGGDEIREISRSGYGQPGPSPGEVIERNSTRSNPTEQLPELELPGRRGLKEDDCGEDIPVFACKDCGHPVYVGRTCASPVCERDWPAAVKDKTIRLAGKLEGMRRMLYVRYNERKNIDFNHVIASLPDFLVDSQQPVDRALLILKTLLEKQWGIDGFAAIYHPYRIKKEYRADQYEHGGEEGEGDMTWKDVLTSDDPEQYIKFEPHFHLFFPAIRASFDYLTAEAVEDQTGWLFHRITKGDESNVSVEDLDDLVHQVTYCFSHAGVNEWNANRAELTSRMKGELHNCYIPDGVEDECLAIFCDAAPKLLGARFTNVAEATCDAEVSDDGLDDADEEQDCSCTDCTPTHSEDSDDEHDHPITDVWPQDDSRPGGPRTGGAPDFSDSSFGVGSGSSSAWDRDEWASFNNPSASPSPGGSVSRTSLSGAAEDDGGDSGGAGSEASETPVADDRVPCGGGLVPIHEAEELLDDEDWCRSAAYVSGLRDAVDEWRRRTGGEEELPWIDDDDLNSGSDTTVVRGDL